MRKLIASILLSYLEFGKKHPVLNIPVSLLLLAACAGGIYLIIVQLPTFAPCLFDAGCR